MLKVWSIWIWSSTSINQVVCWRSYWQIYINQSKYKCEGKVKERFQSWKLGRDDPQQIETFSMVTLFFSLKELVTKLEIQYFTTFHPSIQLFSLFQFRKLYRLLSYYHNAFSLLWPKRFFSLFAKWINICHISLT